MEPTDTILYQAMATTNTSMRVSAIKNILRLELEDDQPGTDLSSCYAVLHFTVKHGGEKYEYSVLLSHSDEGTNTSTSSPEQTQHE